MLCLSCRTYRHYYYLCTIKLYKKT
uniref:Uncharacterized protein n=1 Tax=Arundo donax TaxID=35708 RepID=A0A0A9A708_ARUDO